MDVERLMQDLSVEQLHHIHCDLSSEMETKKEELRQMVGRRYRDVLDASSAVRRVTRMADSLANETHSLRSAASDRCVLHEPKHSSLLTRLSILLKIYHLVGTTDPLSDAFILSLVNTMHRNLSSNTATNAKLNAFLGMLSPKLIRTKLKLEHELLNSLATIHCPHQLTNQLAALALLKKHSLQDLLDVYLAHKLSENTKSASQSLTERVWGMRGTVECIQHVFIQGHLYNTLSIVKSNSWIPSVLRECVQDESLSFGLQVRSEIDACNQHLSHLQVVSIDPQLVHHKSLHFLHSICELFKPSVIQKCELFESSSSLLDFLNVLLDAFKEDWPVIGESVAVYHQLFGTSLIDRFKELIELELSNVEQDLLKRFPSVECHPQALFTKRVPKFDAQLASGVSKELVELVNTFDVSLGKVWHNVTLYQSLGREAAVPQLREQFAVATVAMLNRLCSSSDAIVNTEEGGQAALKALSLARLYLALLQSKTTVISTCLSKNTEHVSQCANLLKSTTEKCFGMYLHQVVKQCAEQSHLDRIATLPHDPFASLSYVQQFEKLNLPEVGTVEVPLQINTLLYNFLHSISLKMSEQSIGHLCSGTVRSQVGAAAREQVLAVYERAAREHKTKTIASRVALQYVFDIRVMHILFPSDQCRTLIGLFEGFIDPFDVSLLSSPIASNARIAAHRYAMVLGNMLTEVGTAKECPLSESYLTVVDIVPRVTDLARFSLIPRLSKHMTSDASMRSSSSSSNIQSRKKVASHLQTEGVRNTPSFSSFSKLATSWFGN